MKIWIGVIVGISVLLVLLELLMSDGSTKKYVQGVIRLILVLAIVSPLLQYLGKQEKEIDFFSEITPEKNPEVTDAQSEVFYDEILENASKKIRNTLLQEGIECDVTIKRKGLQIEAVEITAKETRINKRAENINTNEKIRNVVKTIIEISEDRIFINGA